MDGPATTKVGQATVRSPRRARNRFDRWKDGKLSDLWESNAVESGAAFQEEVRRIVEGAETLIRDSLGAAEVVLIPRASSKHGDVHVLRQVQSSQLEEAATRFLDDYLIQRATGTSIPTVRTMPYPVDGRHGSDQIICRILLDGDYSVCGCLAVRMQEADAATAPHKARLDAISVMVSTMLKAVTTSFELEIELIAAQRRSARLELQTRTDPLTGAQTLGAFEREVRKRLQDSADACALILFEVENLKNVNDLFGYQFGNSYLGLVAGALSAALPDTAIVGRLAGDQFGALVELPERYNSYLGDVLSRCRDSILRSTATLGRPNLGRTSAGAATYPNDAVDYDTLFELAEGALHVSKSGGRGLSTVFAPGMDRRPNPREITRRFNAALSANQIRPYFQPVHNLVTGDCTGFEVLARWEDPDRGVLMPDDFIPILNDPENAERLTQKLTGSALKALADLGPSRAKDLTLAINVTSFDLMNREFAFELQSHLSEIHGLSWSQIIIEVTEKIMLGAAEGQVFRTLEELRRRGARVALDDFGTGYGGLRHLSGWPVDILKIDRHFIGRMLDSEIDRAIVESILHLSESSDLTVIAEGIETPEQLRALQSMNCAKGQGHLFAAALPASGLADSLRTIDFDMLNSRDDW